jgi:hypothetical protein
LNTHMLPIYPTHIAIQSTSKGVKLKETCQGTACIQIFLFGPLRMNALRSWDLGAEKLGVTECQRLCVRVFKLKGSRVWKMRKDSARVRHESRHLEKLEICKLNRYKKIQEIKAREKFLNYWRPDQCAMVGR